MSKAIEQRVKHKLKALSKEHGIPFNVLLNTLFLERFLVRIGSSAHADKLIFKGGMCLANLINLNRETKDIDFLLKKIQATAPAVKGLIEEIALLDVEDGFVFSDVKLSELAIEHKKYPGYRISIQGKLSQTTNKLAIDIGVGDVVRPRAMEIELLSSNGPLFEKVVTLHSYPPEYIFSEKVEAILHLGEINSRMKDFYDCYSLLAAGIMDEQALHHAVLETLENRETTLTPVPDHSEVFDAKWNSFLQKNGLKQVPLKDVIDQINLVLKRIIRP